MEGSSAASVWVLAESRDGTPLPVVLELLTAARSLAPVVDAVAWGPAAASSAATLGSYGARRLLDVGDLGESLPAPRVAAAIGRELEAGRGPDALLIGTSYDGRDVAARLSARIDRPVLTNVVGLSHGESGIVSEHAVFGGSQIARACFTGPPPHLFVVRAKSFAAAPCGGPPCEVVALDAPTTGATDGARVVARHVEAREGPSLDEASVIVSGGRGLGSAGNYSLIEELAKLLGGAAGASRAIVDAGWVPYSHQVGQTGKTVKPAVYLAFGISGATQHLVGMKGAQRVVAVNKDAEAPMIALADLGVVGDALEVLPKLIEALRAR
ncbi:MAG TPA: electron transfer flavoprotein subunit alpha/FixB family protein [Acidimicrobiales bacterium]|nr:electron transfer flavoprotein subunit alpha/FixB family protein [Acidimicrobiales bacterium]